MLGSATDDGLPSSTLAVTWSKVSGPGIANLADTTAAATTATFTVPGTYVLRAYADDGILVSAADVTVTVR